jgi:hypothetical protein
LTPYREAIVHGMHGTAKRATVPQAAVEDQEILYGRHIERSRRSMRTADMTRERPQLEQPRCAAARYLGLAALLLVTLPPPAPAQDIRGLEVCTAEKQMDRRTGCLQANVEFLQQALNKLAHDTQDNTAAADRDLAAARAEIDDLKATVKTLSDAIAQMQAKADSNTKK